MLSSLLNEPLPGHGLFWSSASAEGAAKAYPIPIRVLSFEQQHQPRDLDCASQPADNYASELRQRYEAAVEAAVAQVPEADASDDDAEIATDLVGVGATRDPSTAIRQVAMRALAGNDVIRRRAGSAEGVPWREIQRVLAEALPPEVVGSLVVDPTQWAFSLVPSALNEVYGVHGWYTDKKPSKSEHGRLVTYVWTTRGPNQSRQSAP